MAIFLRKICTISRKTSIISRKILFLRTFAHEAKQLLRNIPHHTQQLFCKYLHQKQNLAKSHICPKNKYQKLNFNKKS